MRSAEDRIMEFVRFSATCDRVRLAEALGLPEPTVTSAVRKLIADGRVEEAATSRPAGAGRPRKAVRAVGPDPLLGVVSWRRGRLALRVARFDGAVVAHRSSALPSADAGSDGLDAAIRELQAVAADVEDAALAAVVVSAPAPYLHGTGSPVEPSAGRTRSRFAIRATGDPEAALSARHGLPVMIENDANLAAIGEQFAGAGRPQHFLYLKLTGEGFGSALVSDGALLRGARGYAGELAHLQLDPDGPICECGGRGCLRSTVFAQALEATRSAYPEPVPFGDLPALARAGDVGAGRVLRDVGRALGRPVGHIATAFDPEVVVVDGALGPEVEQVVAGMRETFSVAAPPAIAEQVRIVVSTLGAQAELIGAIELTREAARRG